MGVGRGDWFHENKFVGVKLPVSRRGNLKVKISENHGRGREFGKA